MNLPASNPASAQPSAGLSIGHLGLRLPGRDAAAGRRVAQQVGDLLAGAGSLATRRVAAVKLQIQAPADASETQLARAVSAAILEHLQRPD